MIEFINFFPGLKCLNLEKNGIKENEMIDVLEKIRRIKKFEDFKILY